MHTVLNLSMGELVFMTTNPVTGVVPLMMKAAEASNVANVAALDDYYADIDEARDSYRTSFAQAVGALDLLLEFDRDGTIALTRARVAEDAVAANRAMYAFGIAPQADPRIADQPFVHGRDTDRLLAPWTAESTPGWTRHQGLHASWLAPILKGMADNWDPSVNGGLTLEAYMKSQGLPTKVVLEDTHTKLERRGPGSLTWWIDYTMRVDFGEIRGNDYHQSLVDIYRDERVYREDYNIWTDKWTPRASERADADSRYNTRLNYLRGS